MKNNKYRLIILAFGIAVLAGCSEDIKQYYGNWECERPSGILTVTISEESWIGIYENGNNYSIDLLSWAPAVNDDPATRDEFPKGYSITGAPSNVNNIYDLNLGEQMTFTIFINKDKTAVLRKQQDGNDFIFTKAGGLIVK